MARRGSGPGFTPRSGSAPGLESLADAATFRLSEAEAAAAASDYQSQFGPWTSQVPHSLLLVALAPADQAYGLHVQRAATRSHTVGYALSRRRTRCSGGWLRSTVRAGRRSRRSSAAKATRRFVWWSAVHAHRLDVSRSVSCARASSQLNSADGVGSKPRSVRGAGSCSTKR